MPEDNEPITKEELIRYGKTALLLLGILAFLLIISNWQYFWSQISYRTNPDRAQQSTEQIRQTAEPNMLFIPSLGVEAPIKFVAETSEAVFQQALQDGVVQYPGTAPVGEVGNTYIFGHSSDFAFAKGDYKTVFALLPNIELGAPILASNASGELFEYKVTDKFVAKKTDTHLLDQETEGKAILTVQTSYPIGTALQRYIVIAELISENQDK